VPRVFELSAELGEVAEAEMHEAFHTGWGMIGAVSEADAEAATPTSSSSTSQGRR
jgi:phosphoribosylaminoimidazole (AIR) synthetase